MDGRSSLISLTDSAWCWAASDHMLPPVAGASAHGTMLNAAMRISHDATLLLLVVPVTQGALNPSLVVPCIRHHQHRAAPPDIISTAQPPPAIVSTAQPPPAIISTAQRPPPSSALHSRPPPSSALRSLPTQPREEPRQQPSQGNWVT